MKNAYKRFEQHFFLILGLWTGFKYHMHFYRHSNVWLSTTFFQNGSSIKTSSFNRGWPSKVVETQRTRTDIESDLSGPFISICAGFFLRVTIIEAPFYSIFEESCINPKPSTKMRFDQMFFIQHLRAPVQEKSFCGLKITFS